METAHELEPRLVRTEYGAWLATTSRDIRLRIGVIGADEQDARERFAASLKRWMELDEENKEEERPAAS